MAKRDFGTTLTRREMLNYVWLGSIGMFAAQLGGGTFLFALPRFQAGEFGGTFEVGGVEALPRPDDPPRAYSEGKFWLVNVDGGILALYKICTHLGCLYNWVASTDHFRCPCHGSEFARGGRRLRTPAPRSLDAFNIHVLDGAGRKITSTRREAGPQDGPYVPVPVRPGEQVVVDTGDLIQSGGPEDGFLG